MNINEINDDKLLGKYLNRGTIEKAPEGFVSKTLTRIRIETAPEKKSFLVRNRVPVISAIVISVLIAAAILVPSPGPGTGFSRITEYIKLPGSLIQGLSDIRIPEITIPGIIIPEWLPYVMMTILLFGFVDRALFRIFNRE
ncbi:MAG: hypothetical protein RBS38_04610 [Bacteroidales bacterium]|jgi:hypothetical protein|nr:hypothetical protein [Bacteroidales bacterium]